MGSIDGSSIKTVNTSLNGSASTNTAAKMRRLKIQEDLLVKSVKKNMSTSYEDNENSFIQLDLDFKKYEAELKRSCADIKHLLEDLKCTTTSQDILETLDIDDVKKDVLELENKIKSFKNILQRDLSELENAEKGLIKQINDDTVQNSKVKKRTKMAKTYIDIIPSPVKQIMNSPHKSEEVQQFQDFLSSSTGRYGGWNEYNHNIFVRIWSKFVGSNEGGYESDESELINNEMFIEEIIEKISGVKRNEIKSHIKWYSKYLHLKKQQQVALNEWREKSRPTSLNQFSNQSNNSRCIKSSNTLRRRRNKLRSNSAKIEKTLNLLDPEQSSDDSEYTPNPKDVKFSRCVDANEFFKEINIRGSDFGAQYSYAKSTKQWRNRCSSKVDNKNLQTFDSNLEIKCKLALPSWRLGLKNE